MTTEPKDVRGGDEAAEQRSAPSPSDPPPVREAVAWRVRRLSDDPEEWQLRPAGAVLDFGNPKRWEIQPLYTTPDPLPVSREADTREALDLALLILGRMEPGDSRAVSNEYVAMMAAGAPHHNDEGRKIIRDAILALTGETSRE